MSDRGTWGSRVGFVLAGAGSAVGLGNIWGFPTRVGENGGAAFVLVYLVCVIFICLPIMIAELAIGRRTQSDPVGAYAKLRPGTRWWMAGGLGVAAGANFTFASGVMGSGIWCFIVLLCRSRVGPGLHLVQCEWCSQW